MHQTFLVQIGSQIYMDIITKRAKEVGETHNT
jgi:hypothetical protein